MLLCTQQFFLWSWSYNLWSSLKSSIKNINISHLYDVFLIARHNRSSLQSFPKPNKFPSSRRSIILWPFCCFKNLRKVENQKSKSNNKQFQKQSSAFAVNVPLFNILTVHNSFCFKIKKIILFGSHFERRSGLGSCMAWRSIL